MLLFFLFTALFFCSVLFMLVNGSKNVHLELSKDLFLSRKHTDAVKGIAAIAIMISHIAARIQNGVSGPTQYYVMLCGTLGGMGVNLFFFASGFGNFYSLKKTDDQVPERLKWLLKRIVSVVSVYLVCFVLTSVVLRIGGYSQTTIEFIKNIVRLRMPLRATWYLKVQILLYIILTISCFFTNKTMQGVMLVGGSFISALLFNKLGYAEEWWKSTMCFAVGYYCAMYKEDVIQTMNRKRVLVGGLSLLLLPLSYGMICLFDNRFIIEILGNTIMMVSMLIIAEYVRLDDRIAGILGTASLEIYLVHISLCSWFLRDNMPDTIGILSVLVWTAVTAIAAKVAYDRIMACLKSFKARK